MEVLVIGVATAFNFLVILWKFKRNRVEDGVLDLVIFAIISAMFAGTIAGMSVGMVASAIVSTYLLFSPPKFMENFNLDSIKKDILGESDNLQK